MAPPEGIKMAKARISYKPPKGDPITEPLVEYMQREFRSSTTAIPDFLGKFITLLVENRTLKPAELVSLFPINDVTKTIKIFTEQT